MTRVEHTSHYLPPDNEQDLTLAWIRRAREAQFAHYEMADLLSRRDKWLGLPVMIITAIVGTSVFASISAEAVSIEAKIVVGLLSVAAAVLSSLQTFFKFSERSEKHRSTGARFSSVRRRLELAYAERHRGFDKAFINTLQDELDTLAQDSPNVPVSIYQRIQKHAHFAMGGSKVHSSAESSSTAHA